MCNVKIIPVAEKFDLHCHYDRQTQQQECYIALNCREKILTASYNGEIGNAIPFSVFHGHIRRYGIPCVIADAANELMDEILPLAQRIVDGYESRWDGNNMVAALSHDAKLAEANMEKIIDDYEADEHTGICEWDASEWFADPPENITANTTDEELEVIAKRNKAEAADMNIVLRGLDEYLVEFRNGMREDD